MRLNLQHLAVQTPLFGRPTGKRSVLRHALSPLGERVEDYLTKIGGLHWLTYNYKGGVRGGTASGPTNTPNALSINEIELDFAAIAADRVAAGAAAIGAADVLELFGVQAGILVPLAFLQTTLAEGATATGDLGDGTTPAGYISNHDLNALGWSSNLITTTYSLATAGGKLYTADDTVDMVVDHASVDVAKVRACVIMLNVAATR